MLRFVIRILSIFSLAFAVMFLVIDATRSVGISEVVWTPFADSWNQFFPDTLDLFSAWLSTTVHPFLNDPILATLLNLPTFAVFAGLAVLLYILGYKRRRRSDYFLDN